MNDLEFEQRAHANPYDKSEEFLAALEENPERQLLLDDILAFDKKLSSSFSSITARDQLKDKLLELADTEDLVEPKTSSKAANDTNWAKLLPIAACLLLTIGIAISFWSKKPSELELAVFSHIYHEIDYLTSTDSVPLSEANQLMTKVVGGQFQQNSAVTEISITKAKECWVARENAIHMVVKGDQGPVTVMLIPNEPVKREVSIKDERFDGVISPTANGNIVVIGEKQEPIHDVSRFMASNISW